MPKKLADQAVKAQERSLGATLMRWSAAGLMVPDPIPLVDEILFGITFGIGAGLYLHGSGVNPPLPKRRGGFAEFKSHPVTSITGHSRGKVKKQMRSTSHSYSRRNNYYKRKRYYRY